MPFEKTHATASMNRRTIDTAIAVFGLGSTGMSCAQFLTTHGLPFTALDTRTEPPALANFKKQYPTTAVLTGSDLPIELGVCKQILLSPGISRLHPLVTRAVDSGVEVIGDIELFARHVRAPVLAITGSNGKSTVVTMVSEVLRRAGKSVLCGGNIGTPALELLTLEKPDCYVLELSSFQLESTASLAPLVACVLNVSPDHMDRYADFASYVSAKARIYQHAQNLVLNFDDEELRALAPHCSTQYFSTNEGSKVRYGAERIRGQLWLVADGEPILAADDLALRGEHNYANALAAIAITDAMGVAHSQQAKCLSDFIGLPHRCQLVANIASVDWIDDSKGTNVGASIAAIKGVFAERSGVLIAGGQAKGADFRQLGAVARGRLHTAILIGKDARLLASSLPPEIDIVFALDMLSAVRTAAAAARSGEAVLLSPACASLDMYENFEARGRAFADAVMALENA